MTVIAFDVLVGLPILDTTDFVEALLVHENLMNTKRQVYRCSYQLFQF